MYKSLNQNLLLYILLLLPFTFIIGIAITEITVVIMTLFFFYKNRSFEFIRNGKFIFLLIFSIYIGISAFIKIDDNLKTSSLFHIRYPIFTLSVIFILDYLNKEILNKNNYLLTIIFSIISFIFFDVFIQYMSGENILGYKILSNRISSVFGPELILGSFLLKLLFLVMWVIFYLEVNVSKNKNYLIVFFSLYFICIYLSGERTSFALMSIFLFLVIFLVAKMRKILLISITLLAVFITLSATINIGKSDPFNRLFVKTFNQITNNLILDNKVDFVNEELPTIRENITKNIQIFSNDHTGHYKLAYYLFLNQPIFGIGPKGFRHYCRSVEYEPKIGICSTHPHNVAIQIISETGIVGFIFYFCGLLFLIIKTYFCIKKDEILKDKNCFLIISIGLFVSLFPFLPGGNFFNNWLSINNYYLLGIYLYSYKKVYK